MKNYFNSLHNEIYSAFLSSRSIGHSVPTGHERELITANFLRRHLPPFIDVSNGTVVDQSTLVFSELTQTTSPQIDILLTMNHHPNLTLYGGTKFYFAESIAAIIEVKSNLTSYNSSPSSLSELDKILKHCGKIKQRTRQILGMYFESPAPSNRIPYYVVAFQADKDAEGLMAAMSARAKTSGSSDDDRLLYQPDGIYVLDPKNSIVILKRVPDHQIRPTEISDNCFAGGHFPNGGVLLDLWFTLFGQIENIRFLRFPSRSYATRVLDITE